MGKWVLEKVRVILLSSADEQWKKQREEAEQEQEEHQSEQPAISLASTKAYVISPSLVHFRCPPRFRRIQLDTVKAVKGHGCWDDLSHGPHELTLTQNKSNRERQVVNPDLSSTYRV